MGQITIDEIHNSLFDYAQAVSDENLITESKTIVGAINETYGKKLIANAIGEPLNSTDTYAKMNNDINSLLSTFKTNMMNAGVTVESNDKFKTLIDKIATMVEEGEGKGIQYASGDGTISSLPYRSSGYQTYVINTNLDFTPTVIFWTVESLDYRGEYGSKTGWELYETANSLINVSRSTCLSCSLSDAAYDCNFYLSNVNSESFTLNYEISLVTYSGACGNVVYHWYAIGVGEEDTTLRDSLASILEDEGVDVTEEDTMADLITKVDEEFDRKNANKGLDIISATKLPATGRKNQICVITDNPVDSFLLTPDKTSNNDTSYITVYTGDSSTHNNVKVELNNNNILQNYYFYRTTQGSTRLASYIYQNNNWTQLTISTVVFYSQGTFYNTNIHGGLYSGNSYLRNDGKVLTESTSATRTYASFNNKIDFSQFNYARISGYTNYENGGIRISATDAKSNSGSQSGNLLYESKEHAITTNPTTVTIDISGYNDIAYLTLNLYASADHVNVSITDIEFY